MNIQQIRAATKIAMDYTIDLSHCNDSILFGFGTADFVPVYTDLYTVAKCMRWQSSQMNGGWDWKQYNEDLPFYKKNVLIANDTEPEGYRINETEFNRQFEEWAGNSDGTVGVD